MLIRLRNMPANPCAGFILLLLCITSAAFGCRQRDSNDEDKTQAPPGVPETVPPGVIVQGTAEPAANTRILSPTATGRIRDYDPAAGLMTIEAGEEVPDDLAVGDIVVARISAKTPAGALVRVTAAARDGDLWRLSVAQASLREALKSADFSIKMDLNAAQASFAPSLPGAAVTPSSDSQLRGANLAGDDKSGFTLGMSDVPVLDVDGDTKTTHDQLTMTASVFFELGLDIAVKTEGLSIKELSITAHGRESGTVELKGEASTKFGKKTDVGVMVFPPIVIPVGSFPLVLTSGIDLSLGVAGEATAKLRTSASEEAAFRVGAGYIDGAAQLIKEASADGSYQAPTITGTHFTAKGSLGARARLALYGVAGAWAGAGAYAEIKAEPAKGLDLCAIAKVGVEAQAGLNAGIFGLSIADWSKEVTIAEKSLASRACNVTGGTGDDPTPGWRYVADGSTDDKTALQAVAPTPDGGVVFARSANIFSYVQKHDAAGAVDWRYGATGASVPTLNRIALTLHDGSGDYIVAGTLGSQILLMRLTAGGQLRWAKTYDRSGTWFVNGIAETSDGTIAAVGKTYDADDPSDDVFVLKVKADGTPAALLRLKGAVDIDGANAVAAGADGRLYIGGTTRVPVSGTSKFYGFVLALAANNSIAWSKGVAIGETTALAGDGAGGVLAAGFFEDMVGGELTRMPWTARIGSTGNRAWGTGLKLAAKPAAIARTSDGAVVAGTADFAFGDKTGERGFVARYGKTGGVLWSRSYRAAAREHELHFVYERPDERLVAGGYRVPAPDQTESWWLSLPRDGNAAAAGTEVKTLSGSTGSLAGVLDAGFTIKTLPVKAVVHTLKWVIQAAPKPTVLATP